MLLNIFFSFVNSNWIHLRLNIIRLLIYVMLIVYENRYMIKSG